MPGSASSSDTSSGHHAAVLVDHGDRARVQPQGPARVAEPTPGPDRFGGEVGGQIGRRRPASHPVRPGRQHAMLTGVCCSMISLTRTAHADRVGIAPRQIARVRVEPTVAIVASLVTSATVAASQPGPLRRVSVEAVQRPRLRWANHESDGWSAAPRGLLAASRDCCRRPAPGDLAHRVLVRRPGSPDRQEPAATAAEGRAVPQQASCCLG